MGKLGQISGDAAGFEVGGVKREDLLNAQPGLAWLGMLEELLRHLQSAAFLELVISRPTPDPGSHSRNEHRSEAGDEELAH